MRNLLLLGTLLVGLWATPLPAVAQTSAITGQPVTLPGTGQPVTGELFAAPGEGRHPAVLLLHGRRGIEPFAAFYRRTAAALAAAGVDAYLVSYYDAADRRVIATRDPAQQRALFQNRLSDWTRLVRSLLGDILARRRSSGQLGLVGFSQGGFLATAVGSADPRVTALVVYYGGIPTVLEGRINHLPPLLELHGTADTVVAPAQGQALVALGRKLGQPAGIVLLPGAGHGFDGANAHEAETRMLAFLRQWLLGKNR